MVAWYTTMPKFQPCSHLDGLSGTLSGDMTADITSLDVNVLCKDVTQIMMASDI